MKATASTPTGTAIARYLISRGVRQNWVAEQIGMDQARLNRFLKGARYHHINRDLVERVADALDVPAAIRREWLALLSTSSSEAA